MQVRPSHRRQLHHRSATSDSESRDTIAPKFADGRSLTIHGEARSNFEGTAYGEDYLNLARGPS